MNEFHTDKVNLKYYAENNTPSFYQIKAKDHHFFDKKGRKYIIMVKDGQPFKNKKFQTPLPRGRGKRRDIPAPNVTGGKPKECVVNNYGEITMYVKLANGTEWFLNSEIGRYLTLYERREKNEVQIKLKSTLKVNYKSKMGRITVQGLTAEYCNTLLNTIEDHDGKKKRNTKPVIFSFEGLL